MSLEELENEVRGNLTEILSLLANCFDRVGEHRYTDINITLEEIRHICEKTKDPVKEIIG